MSPFAINFGYAWRLVAAFNLAILVMIAIAITPNHLGAVATGLISALVMPTLAVMTIRLWKRPSKERFAVATIIANASLSLFLAAYAITDPSSPNLATYVLASMSAWFGYMAYRRHRDLENGAYLRRFVAKPKLASPFDVLKRGS